jgi:hypothetical protein
MRRCTSKFVSLLLLSAQESATEAADCGVATREEGAAGRVALVVTVTTFEKGDDVPPFKTEADVDRVILPLLGG